jgi:NADH dehydrogenase FAD-containing subunit
MAKHLVLIGGGHAHREILLRLRDVTARGHRVTLVNPSPYHYYSGMGPGMLSGVYRPQEVRVNVGAMALDRGAVFLEDMVVRVDAGERLLFLASGGQVRYDVASFNIGSVVPIRFEGAARRQEHVFPVKPFPNLLDARRFVLDKAAREVPDVVVAGGGAAGVETAANLWRFLRDRGREARIAVIERGALLSEGPPRARRLARLSLARRGIRVLEGKAIEEVAGPEVRLDDGSILPADAVLATGGVAPPPLFRESDLPVGDDGALLVNERLECVARPEIFGGGDSISLKGYDLARVGVHAVRQQPILFRNIRAALDGGTMRRFVPQRRYLLILNMGDGTGILFRGRLALNGRLAFRIKDRIDRRFMRRYQVSSERDAGG